MPASEQASCEMPSIRQPSPRNTQVRWSTMVWPGRLNSAASSRSASAMPTALARPWPSGPVVVSTPGVMPTSGWPGVLRVQLAEALAAPPSAGIAGQVQQRVLQHRAVAVGQHEAVAVGPVRVGGIVLEEVRATALRRCPPCPSACPGWPEFAASTASIASMRMALASSARLDAAWVGSWRSSFHASLVIVVSQKRALFAVHQLPGSSA